MQESKKLIPCQAGLVQNGKKRAARDVFALRNNDQPGSTGGVFLVKGAVTSLASVWGFGESGRTQSPNDLFG